MEDTRDDAGPAEQGPPNASWWPSDFMERFGSVSLGSQEETLSNMDSPRSLDQDVFSSQKTSQVLWQTGMLFEPIPNGFYSLIPVRFNFWRQLIVICCSYCCYCCFLLHLVLWMGNLDGCGFKYLHCWVDFLSLQEGLLSQIVIFHMF